LHQSEKRQALKPGAGGGLNRGPVLTERGARRPDRERTRIDSPIAHERQAAEGLGGAFGAQLIASLANVGPNFTG